ncbi:hypothetical protein L226DRAFT_538571 [Lentinus tigrinus ALCF2SS1-7]|uniref:uncharacterized protein n=1 Tax=Lentinus tigrinus ALCF2SS1-7 TaxID=1328758 RepID=UPI0011662094|nr:hypothetical protein L226DRAFT_538571 [Lentinus tigrinus ALCF2SS1-7]
MPPAACPRARRNEPYKLPASQRSSRSHLATPRRPYGPPARDGPTHPTTPTVASRPQALEQRTRGSGRFCTAGAPSLNVSAPSDAAGGCVDP